MKKFIILISISIVIIVVALLILLQYMQPNTNKENEIFEVGHDNENNINRTYRKLTLTNDYFRVKEIVDRYYANIATMNGEGEEVIEYEVEGEEYPSGGLDLQEYNQKEQEQAKIALYAMLGNEYIQEFQITIDNVKQKLSQDTGKEILLEDIYIVENSLDVNSYYIYGKKLQQEKMVDFSMLISIDSKNETFAIYLSDYIKTHNLDSYKENQEIDTIIESIEDKTYNKTLYKAISDNQVAKEYYDNYKKLLNYDTNLLYEKLETEYQRKKFTDLEYFNNYITANKQILQNRNITQYNKINRETYTQYVCLDQTGKMIIFNANSLTEYSIILDTYTIDLPEYMTKYASATDEDKVLMNIQRIFEAIDDGDYQYVYNKLDPTFRSNNFATQADFETYVKQNFFAQNKVSAEKAQKQGDLYLYNVTISDTTGKDTNTKKKNFVMQLREGTDFVMSFGI